MDRSSVTRRGLVVAAGVALGGCSALSDENDTSTSKPNGNETADEPAEPTAPDDGTARANIEERRDRMPDPAVTVDWDEVREFRKWLTDDRWVQESNRRFDYTEDLLPEADLGPALPDTFDVGAEDIDGQLAQSGTLTFLGEFDAAALEAALEDADGYDLQGTVDGYAVADERDDDTFAGVIAVGDDAILVGEGYEAAIDARHGDGKRLEAVDPWFTHVFETLPDGSLVSGQYLPPRGAGIDIDEIYCWGISMASVDSGTATWAYVFDDPDAVTDDAREQLRSFTPEVHAFAVDGRTVTIEGTLPEFSSGREDDE